MYAVMDAAAARALRLARHAPSSSMSASWSARCTEQKRSASPLTVDDPAVLRALHHRHNIAILLSIASNALA
jgi:hypothetical protein